MKGGAYHADANPEEAWEILATEPGGAMVDVRTTAEWNFVGTPDLSAKQVPFVRVEWQSYPTMQVNAGFVEATDKALRGAGVRADAPVFFICRSGARSAAAAAAMTAAGYSRCYNIAGGFEGNRDEKGHRGSVEGWKAANLPWIQS